MISCEFDCLGGSLALSPLSWKMDLKLFNCCVLLTLKEHPSHKCIIAALGAFHKGWMWQIEGWPRAFETRNETSANISWAASASIKYTPAIPPVQSTDGWTPSHHLAGQAHLHSPVPAHRSRHLRGCSWVQRHWTHPTRASVGCSQQSPLLEVLVELRDRVINHGIVRRKFTLSGQSVLDLALDFLNQLSCLALHWFVCDRSLWVPGA